MQILILCFPATGSNAPSKIRVMLQRAGQHGRAPWGAFSPTLLPKSKPVHGNTPPGTGHSGVGTGCLSKQTMQDMPSHPKLPPLPGHALAGERLDLNQSGRGQGGHLKHSERLWAGRSALACSLCP